MLFCPDLHPIWLDYVIYVQPNTGSGSLTPPPPITFDHFSSLGLSGLNFSPSALTLFFFSLTFTRSFNGLEVVVLSFYSLFSIGCIGPCSISQLSILSIHIPHNAIVGLVT